MDPFFPAVVIGPNIMTPETGEVESFKDVNKVVEILIENYPKIFKADALEDFVEQAFHAAEEELANMANALAPTNPAPSVSSEQQPSATPLQISKEKQLEMKNSELDRIKEEKQKLTASKRRSVEFGQPPLNPASYDASTQSSRSKDRSTSSADTKGMPVISPADNGDKSQPNLPERPIRPGTSFFHLLPSHLPI